MTDPTPALQPVLTSRQAQTPEHPAQLSAKAQDLEVSLRHAQAVATAEDAIPKFYRRRPGAVLLAQEWAQRRDVDLLTAMQTVAFIDGKPVVEATMLAALAERAGYVVSVVETTTESATVAVSRGGVELGRASYTMDQARTAGLANKNTWKAHPANMLVARARTQCLRFYAPSVMVGLSTPDEVESDPVEVLTTTPTLTVVPDEAADDEPVDAEVVPEPAEPATGVVAAPVAGGGVWSDRQALIDTLKAHGVTQAEAIGEARQMASALGIEAPSSVAGIVDAPDVLQAEILRWLEERQA